MKRTWVSIFAAGVLACIALGYAWVHMHGQRLNLRAERAQLRAEWSRLEIEAQQWRAEKLARKMEASAMPVASLPPLALTPAERARATVGLVVAQLKDSHRRNQPPRRPPPPPSGPNGPVFAELMDDPVYRAAYSEMAALSHADSQTALEQLGVPAETVGKVVDLLVDKNFTGLDVAAVANTLGSSAGSGAVYQIQLATIDSEIRALLGEEMYARYKQVDPYTLENFSRVLAGQLETRLSYSPEPLREAQVDALAAAIAQDPDYLRGGDWINEAFVLKAQQLLTPSQFRAVAALREETLAKEKRARLPRVEAVPTPGG